MPEGEAGLADRSSRPHHSPTRLSEPAEAEIEALRRQRCPAPPSPASSAGRSPPSASSCAGAGSAGSHALDPKPEIVRYQREHGPAS